MTTCVHCGCEGSHLINVPEGPIHAFGSGCVAALQARAAELAAEVDRLKAAAAWKNSYTTPPAHGANVVFANFGGAVAYVAHYHHGGYAPPWYFVPPPIPNEISDEHAANYKEHGRLVDLVDQLQRDNTALRSQLAAAGQEWRAVDEPPAADMDVEMIVCGGYRYDDNEFFDEFFSQMEMPTHWRPATD